MSADIRNAVAAVIGALATFLAHMFKKGRHADAADRIDKLEQLVKKYDLRYREIMTRIDSLEQRIQDGELKDEEQARELRALQRVFREGFGELLSEFHRLAEQVRPMPPRKRDAQSSA